MISGIGLYAPDHSALVLFCTAEIRDLQGCANKNWTSKYQTPNLAYSRQLMEFHQGCFFRNLVYITNPAKSHDDVIKWKHFPRYWPFVRGIHRSPVNSPHKGQWHGALMFSLIWARTNTWVNNCEAGDLRRHRVHYDVIVMWVACPKILHIS